jgi:hypothetical protein
VCMDEQHYFELDSWYEAVEASTFDVYSAWSTATYEWSPVWGDRWTATYLPTGAETVYGQSNFNSHVGAAFHNWLNATNARADFEANAVLC